MHYIPQSYGDPFIDVECRFCNMIGSCNVELHKSLDKSVIINTTCGHTRIGDKL
jgi:hypothetical protein